MVPLTRYLSRAMNETTVTRPAVLVALDGDHVVGGHGALQEALRGEIDLQPPALGVLRPGHYPVDLAVPRILAPDHPVPDPVPHDRRAAAAPRGIVPLPDDHLLGRRFGLEVDGAGVLRQLEARPVLGRGEILARGAHPAVPGVPDGHHVVDAHRLGGGLQHRLRVLRRGRPGRQHRDGNEKSNSLQHDSPPRSFLTIRAGRIAADATRPALWLAQRSRFAVR